MVSPPRRVLLILVGTIAILSILFLSHLQSSPNGIHGRDITQVAQHDSKQKTTIGHETLTGHAIAPKLGNETAKAELGRAAWKLFHTTMARFPDNPTEDESLALKSYIHLFQRLYPCGECAEHFGKILEKFPPQVSSRSVAAAWACHVHNQVNKSLKKPEFNCGEIGDFYDCGCAGDDDEEAAAKQTKTTTKTRDTESTIPDDEREPVRLQKEDYQRGG